MPPRDRSRASSMDRTYVPPPGAPADATRVQPKKFRELNHSGVVEDVDQSLRGDIDRTRQRLKRESPTDPKKAL